MGLVRARLEVWKKAKVISAGQAEDTGEDIPAYTVPIVEVSGGAVTVSFEVGWVGEVDHARIKGTVRRAALSSTQQAA